MVKLVIVRDDGREEEIAECAFSDDGKMLFDSYAKDNRHHVKLVYYGIFSQPIATDEHKPHEAR